MNASATSTLTERVNYPKGTCMYTFGVFAEALQLGMFCVLVSV